MVNANNPLPSNGLCSSGKSCAKPDVESGLDFWHDSDIISLSVCSLAVMFNSTTSSVIYDITKSNVCDIHCFKIRLPSDQYNTG